MYWQEQNDTEPTSEIEVTDILFNIQCKMLPVDHAYELYQAIEQSLPLINNLVNAGIHAIHVAESGNGWMRPPDGEYLHLSKRTKLILRIPLDKIDEVSKTLGHTTINIATNSMNIGSHKLRPIQASKTIFSRYIVCQGQQTEEEFLHWILQMLQTMDIHPKKMLCGRPHTLNTGEGPLLTRSLMIADMSKPDSIRLQQYGLGSHRLMGCGIFLPHKGIDAVKEAAENKLPNSFGLKQ